MGRYKPKDRKNPENRVFSRYAFRSGQMHSIHGMANFQVDTAESQVFGFYSNTGQGGTEGGPGTGKALLYTPGMSTEVLGTGLKVRNAGDNTELPAKIIRCKNGDVIVDCYNGNITLRGRNITLDANGGGQDGQIVLSANRIINAKAPDIRLQGEKVLIDATNRCDIISKGFFQLKYGFSLAAAHGDMDFGVLTQTLKKDILATPKTLGDE
tara:strand:+ start:2150 stop:2782 length:633 start_codon:yes stop_codon:yes gene_type:complete